MRCCLKYVYGYKYKLKLYDDVYHIQLHKDNKVSVCKNGVQTALIEKDWLHSPWKSSYKILFNAQIDIYILNFIAMFVDLVMFDFGKFIFVLGTKTVLYDDAKELGEWKLDKL